MRCDVNLSLREQGEKSFGTRTETKNINSLSNIVKAMNKEIERQTEILSRGGQIIQATMRYDAQTDKIYPMRTKENSDDYRYFPDPDILSFTIDEDFIEGVRKSLPEFPSQKKKRYVEEFKIPQNIAEDIYKYRSVATFFDETVKEGADAKNTANMIVGTIYSTLDNEEAKENFKIKVTPKSLAELVRLIDTKKINKNKAGEVLNKMLETGKGVTDFITYEDTQSISQDELIKICKRAVNENRSVAENVKNGNDKAINVLFGYVMRETKGRADMVKVGEIIRKLIK